jgi:hypothetical protein
MTVSGHGLAQAHRLLWARQAFQKRRSKPRPAEHCCEVTGFTLIWPNDGNLVSPSDARDSY